MQGRYNVLPPLYRPPSARLQNTFAKHRLAGKLHTIRKQQGTMDKKFSSLLARLSAMGSLGIAYSGGLDSRFLAMAASLAKTRCTLFHFSGPHVSKTETAQALAWANHHGLTTHIVPINILKIPEVQKNCHDRCYHCKLTLFSILKNVARALVLCDGTNATDLRSPRPGLKALKELKITSPLADAGFEKFEIRDMARRIGLELPDQPARPCLMTRFAYDMHPVEAQLHMIEILETEIESILQKFFPDAASVPDFRVRVTAAHQAELHVAAPLTCEQIHTLQAVLETFVATEIPKHLTTNNRELDISMFIHMPVRISNTVSGYHDRNHSGA